MTNPRFTTIQFHADPDATIEQAKKHAADSFGVMMRSKGCNCDPLNVYVLPCFDDERHLHAGANHEPACRMLTAGGN